MHTTSPTLLARLQNPHEKEAWIRFVEIYTPLLFHWARRQGLQESDAADLVQDVFLHLIRKLPEFSYEPGGSFRSWLRTVTLNKIREKRRRTVPAPAGDQLPEPEVADPLELLAETEFRAHAVQTVLRALEPQFPVLLWRAFHEYVVLGKEPAAVAKQLGVTTGTVYAAKSKVISKLRQELDGLLD